MTRLLWIVLAGALALPLGGCANISDALDPSEWFAGDLFNTKKKLPGERKPVFPEGVPGVAQGIPSDLVKGNQPPSSSYAGEPQVTAATPQAGAAPEQFRPAPRDEAKPKPKAKAKEPTPERAPTAVTVRRAPDSQPQPQQQPQPQPQPQQQEQAAGQWPDPPPLRSVRPGAVQWPDPPPLR